MLFRFMQTLARKGKLEDITTLARAEAQAVIERDPAKLALTLDHGSRQEEVAILRFTDDIQAVRVARGLAQAETAAVEQAAVVVELDDEKGDE